MLHAGFNGSYFGVVPHEVLSHLYFKRWSCDTSYGSIAYPKHRREERQHLNHLPFTIYLTSIIYHELRQPHLEWWLVLRLLRHLAKSSVLSIK